MSIMSAAEAGRPTGRMELSPPGTRMAGSVSDPDGAGADAGSPGGRPVEESGPPRSAGHDRRLRLVATQVHVTKVRVAREFRSSAVRVGAPRGSAQAARAPGLGRPRAGGEGLGAPQAGGEGLRAPRAGGEGLGRPRAGAQRAVRRDAAGSAADVRQAAVQRVSAERVTAPGVTAHRVRMQRASASRVSVRAAAAAPGTLRLTRRGRRVLTALVMLVVIVAAMLIWTSVAGGAQVPGPGSPARSPYQGMAQIVVQPGQTLWSVAAAADPSADPWTVIQQISDVNALNGAQVEAGQLLWVPRG